MTSSSVMSSETSTAQSYEKASLAGSRFTTATLRSKHVKNCCMPLQNVDLPLPGGPMMNWPNMALAGPP